MFTTSLRPVISVTALLLLALAFSIGGVSAQEGESPEVLLTLSEAEINEEFNLPSRVNVAVGDVNLDLMADGSVAVAFEATLEGRNGTTRTNGIIAILIGLVRGRSFTYTLENVQITSLTDGTSNTMLASERRNFSFIAAAFNRYLRGQIRQAGVTGPYEVIVTDTELQVVARGA